MDGKGIIFNGNSETPYSERTYSITVWGDAEQYLLTIEALLTLVGIRSSDDIDYYAERQRACEMIRAMLPSYEQIREIERAQLQTNSTQC
jgi:hypothetical protein